MKSKHLIFAIENVMEELQKCNSISMVCGLISGKPGVTDLNLTH